MNDVYLQVNIYGWSLQKLADESVNLPLILKVGGLDSFSITEFHWKKAENNSPNDEDVIIEEETFDLNTNEVDTKPPFCSTPRMSLLTPVPFPPIEASRISANPAKMIEWISRRENTLETLTEIVETETTLPGDSDKSLERTLKELSSFTQPNNELDDAVLENENLLNASFHSVSSSISAEVEGIRDLQRMEEYSEHSEQNASFTSGIEKVCGNFDAPIQFEGLEAYPSFDFCRTVSADVSEKVYQPLSSCRIDSTHETLSKPLSSCLSYSYPQDTELMEHWGNQKNEEEGVIQVEEELGQTIKQNEKRKNAMHSIQCNFEGCGKSYSWMKKYGKTRLIDHVLRHVPDQQLKCSQCEFACKAIRALRTHQSRVHKDVDSDATRHKNLAQTISEDPQFMKIWNMCFPRELMNPFMRQDKNIRRPKRSTINRSRSVDIKREHSF